jgi:hypothetical protein
MRLSIGWIFFFCLVLCGVRLLYPGDTPFNTDENQLLIQAWRANQEHAWTTHGLRGTRGIDYGPIPILLYRGGLFLTQNLEHLILLKTFLTSVATMAALFALLALCPWISPLAILPVFLSLYFWVYARDLWDNSWNIPFTALAFVTYLAFVHTRRKIWLAISVLWIATILQIHLLCLPLVFAVGWHFFWKERRWARSHVLFCLLLLLGAVGLLSPYLGHLLSTPQTPSPQPFGPGVLHFVFSFLGFRLFTAAGFEYFLGPLWYTAL